MSLVTWARGKQINLTQCNSNSNIPSETTQFLSGLMFRVSQLFTVQCFVVLSFCLGIALSVLLSTTSDYSYSIFKLFYKCVCF